MQCIYIVYIVYIYIYIYILYIYIYIYVYTMWIYININFECLNMKMSNQNLFKKTCFYIKSVIFRFAQKPQDCALNKKCKNYINMNNSKNTKEQLKVE